MIRIIEVRENKITALVNGEIIVEFLRIEDKIIETSRLVETSRLSSRKPWIPKKIYGKLIRQINAIFKSRDKSREKRSPPYK